MTIFMCTIIGAVIGAILGSFLGASLSEVMAKGWGRRYSLAFPIISLVVGLIVGGLVGFGAGEEGNSNKKQEPSTTTENYTEDDLSQNNSNYTFKCNECNYEIFLEDVEFCPKCGTKQK